MNNNEDYPPSFTPQNRKKTVSNKNNPIIVGKNNSIHHCPDNSQNLEKKHNKKNTLNKNTPPNTNIPPSYIPLSQRQPKPNTYNAKNSGNINTPRTQNENSSFSRNISSYQKRVEVKSPKATNYNSSIPNNYPDNQKYNSLNNKKKTTTKYNKIRKRLLTSLVILLLVSITWPAYLFYRANSQLTSVEALSSLGTTSEGTTWLIAGSDSRENSHIQDNTEGQRADSIIMVHKAPNGQASMISIPRDTMANIPGYGLDKINASFSYGGPKLLVETVEGLTNTKIDHYIQIGMNGVEELVNAVNGINLCLDYDVNDPNSQLVWNAGCHDTDGKTALAFARMRYSDPLSDLGRADRQRQVISKLMNKVFTPSILLNPISHIALVDAGSQSVTTDIKSTPYDIGMLALAFRKARNDNISGIPPIESMNYVLLSGISTVLLDRNQKDSFFEKMRKGILSPEDFQKF